MNRRNIAVLGIILCSIYFIVTFVLILTSSQIWLAALELVTMISGILMILLVLAIPFSQNEKMLIYKIIGIICSASCMLLTNVVHMVNLTVTDQLIRKGIEIPYYLLIGKWPSVGMAIDYLAWGFFMGFAFLFSSFGVEKVSVFKSIKITLFVCGCLCFAGFFGAILFNQNLWYIAPLGYGIGTMLICFELLILNKKIK